MKAAPAITISSRTRRFVFPMRAVGLTLTAFAVSSGTLDAQLTAPAAAIPATLLAFQGVTVIDVRNGRRRHDQTVVVRGTRIQRIIPAEAARIPSGVRVIDARGKYLIPGLWDMHVHPKRYVDIAYPLFIANGVTGIRDGGSDVPLDTLTAWKREIAAGTRVGPRLLVSGPAILEADSGQTTVARDTGLMSHFLKVPRARIRRVVDSLHAAGADFLKTYHLSPPMYFEMAAEARRIGMRFGGHAAETGGIAASDSGAALLDHEAYLRPDVCGSALGDIGADGSLPACAAAARRLRRNGTWVTLLGHTSLFFLTGPFQDAVIGRLMANARRYRPASFPRRAPAITDSQVAVARHPASTEELRALSPATEHGYSVLHEADAPIVIGTDAGLLPIPADNLLFGMALMVPGVAVHDALEGLALGGMSPLQALQAATLNPARALRATDSMGVVAKGKVADLVLLDADPLVDVSHLTRIRGVVANGRYFDRAALDALLAQAEQAAARQ